MDARQLDSTMVINGEAGSNADAIDFGNVPSFDESNAGEDGTIDMEEEVKASSAVTDEAAETRKCRARLRRMMRTSSKPSFIALISPTEDSGSDVEVRIDVDEYLGLKPEAIVDLTLPDGEDKQKVTAGGMPLPSDEGWYEGAVPLSLPGEERYLNELHHFVRSHLELFSAKQEDIAISLPGRRTPTVLGKVGLRCIHCSKASKGSKGFPATRPMKTWPPGSVSYPANISGIYPVCSTKPTLHFEKCPNFPLEARAELYRLSNDEIAPAKRQRKMGHGNDARGAVGTGMYYSIAARQLGLVDVKGGIRFGRDLTLEPLPMETIRAQIEHIPASYRRTGLMSPEKPDAVVSAESRISADEESERLLASAVAEKDDEARFLARSSDKNLVTDFMFLCIRQMAICHADEEDFATRGKKTKSMRIGFAGFCCRHCTTLEDPHGSLNRSTNFTCRSFSSAPDNLASAISNSFYSHLEKCWNVPVELKRAMGAYKRLHTRQMRQLSYGSQRKLFHQLWARLRSADLTAEEMFGRRKTLPRGPSGPSNEFSTFMTNPVERSSPRPDAVGSMLEDWSNWTRPPSFPVSSDEETNGIVRQAEREIQTNSHVLLQQSDRQLISDFVFVIIMQLKVAHPSVHDFTRGKRSTVLSTSQPGLRCKHCMHDEPRFTTTGRSFPSQPDNIASTLNTSLYQHMLKCQFIPNDLKRALANLKKLHSTQISCLRFGAQRRFFKILFDRLSAQRIVVDDQGSSEATPVAAMDEALRLNGFIRTVGECFECQQCRMVPYALRAQDSLSFVQPTIDFTSDHSEVCAKDSFDVSFVAEILAEASSSCPDILQDTTMSPGFKLVIEKVFGANEQLCDIFANDVIRVLKARNDPLAKRRQVNDLKVKSRGLWSQLPSSIDTEKVVTALETVVSTPSALWKKHFIRYLQAISPALVMHDRSRPDEAAAKNGVDTTDESR